MTSTERKFTVEYQPHIMPTSSQPRLDLNADHDTQVWARSKPGRQQALGFIVDLLEAYVNDRPIYRGRALETWERDLADHEHTAESVASYFRDRLRDNFPDDAIVVDLAA